MKHPLFKVGDRVRLTHSGTGYKDIIERCGDTGEVLLISSHATYWQIFVRLDDCCCDKDYPGCDGFNIGIDGIRQYGCAQIAFTLIEKDNPDNYDNRFESIIGEL